MPLIDVGVGQVWGCSLGGRQNRWGVGCKPTARISGGEGEYGCGAGTALKVSAGTGRSAVTANAIAERACAKTVKTGSVGASANTIYARPGAKAGARKPACITTRCGSGNCTISIQRSDLRVFRVSGRIRQRDSPPNSVAGHRNGSTHLKSLVFDVDVAATSPSNHHTVSGNTRSTQAN